MLVGRAAVSVHRAAFFKLLLFGLLVVFVTPLILCVASTFIEWVLVGCGVLERVYSVFLE